MNEFNRVHKSALKRFRNRLHARCSWGQKMASACCLPPVYFPLSLGSRVPRMFRSASNIYKNVSTSMKISSNALTTTHESKRRQSTAPRLDLPWERLRIETEGCIQNSCLRRSNSAAKSRKAAEPIPVGSSLQRHRPDQRQRNKPLPLHFSIWIR